MREQGAVIGVNGYDEARVFYTSPAFAGKRPLDETRTIHMAIDLTLPAGAPVYAPLAATVHGFMEATDRLDYGPVIVLKHDAAGVPFYTLYGHLGRASLDGLYIGKPIAAGERVGWLGAAPVNGDWWPHVHFQANPFIHSTNLSGSGRQPRSATLPAPLKNRAGIVMLPCLRPFSKIRPGQNSASEKK